MIEVTTGVVGAVEVEARLKSAADKARPTLRARVQKLGIELQRKVKAEKLSGQVLHVQSGNLRRNINEDTRDESDAIVSSVGTNIVYGRAWELGFSRPVGPGARGGGLRGRLAAAVSVRQYDPRPFLQPSLAEMRPRINEQLHAAAVAVAKGES